jgi:hypothetical protein
MTRYLVAIFFLLTSTFARAEMPDEVIESADDTVGSRLVYAVKEKIRSSSSLEITFDKTIYRMQARFVTLDGNDSGGRSTTYSMVLTFAKGDEGLPLYLDQITGVCGSSRVQECADGLVADISKTSDFIISATQNSNKR